MISLPKEVRDTVRSGVVITAVSQCVEELVLNSLDAGASCVAVRTDLNLRNVQVVDNGCGMSRGDLNKLGQRFMTSKCRSLQDLKRFLFHGYKGEAISSILALCTRIDVETRKQSQTLKRRIVEGSSNDDIEICIGQRPSEGTTVTVQGLFDKFPVRRKSLEPALEKERIINLLRSFSLIYHRVSFSLRDETSGIVVFQSRRHASVATAFRSLFGSQFEHDLYEVKVSKDDLEIHCHISKSSHSDKSLQFVSLNHRILVKSTIHEFMDKFLRSSAHFKQLNKGTCPTSRVRIACPIFLIQILSPYSEFDMILDPTRTLLEFHDWTLVTTCLQKAVDRFQIYYTEEDDTVNGVTAERQDELSVRRGERQEIRLDALHESLFSKPARRCVPTDCELVQNYVDASKSSVQLRLNLSDSRLHKQALNDVCKDKTAENKMNEDEECSVDNISGKGMSGHESEISADRENDGGTLNVVRDFNFTVNPIIPEPMNNSLIAESVSRALRDDYSDMDADVSSQSVLHTKMITRKAKNKFRVKKRKSSRQADSCHSLKRKKVNSRDQRSGTHHESTMTVTRRHKPTEPRSKYVSRTGHRKMKKQMSNDLHLEELESVTSRSGRRRRQRAWSARIVEWINAVSRQDDSSNKSTQYKLKHRGCMKERKILNETKACPDLDIESNKRYSAVSNGRLKLTSTRPEQKASMIVDSVDCASASVCLRKKLSFVHSKVASIYKSLITTPCYRLNRNESLHHKKTFADFRENNFTFDGDVEIKCSTFTEKITNDKSSIDTFMKDITHEDLSAASCEDRPQSASVLEEIVLPSSSGSMCDNISSVDPQTSENGSKSRNVVSVSPSLLPSNSMANVLYVGHSRNPLPTFSFDHQEENCAVADCQNKPHFTDFKSPYFSSKIGQKMITSTDMKRHGRNFIVLKTSATFRERSDTRLDSPCAELHDQPATFYDASIHATNESPSCQIDSNSLEESGILSNSCLFPAANRSRRDNHVSSINVGNVSLVGVDGYDTDRNHDESQSGSVFFTRHHSDPENCKSVTVTVHNNTANSPEVDSSVCKFSPEIDQIGEEFETKYDFRIWTPHSTETKSRVNDSDGVMNIHETSMSPCFPEQLPVPPDDETYVDTSANSVKMASIIDGIPRESSVLQIDTSNASKSKFNDEQLQIIMEQDSDKPVGLSSLSTRFRDADHGKPESSYGVAESAVDMNVFCDDGEPVQVSDLTTVTDARTSVKIWDDMTMIDDRRWMLLRDVQGRPVYVDRVSGNSRLDKPQTSLSGVLDEAAKTGSSTFTSHVVLSHGARHFKPRSKEERTYKICDQTEIDKIMLQHKEAADGGIDVKWRTHYITHQGMNNIQNSLANWKNPIYEREKNILNLDHTQNVKLLNIAHKIHHFAKQDLSKLEVIGQVDDKFIACMLNTTSNNGRKRFLVLIDQHAAHERVRLELYTQNLQHENGTLRSSATAPLRFTFTHDDLHLLDTYKDKLSKFGLEYDICDDGVIVRRVPRCYVSGDGQMELDRDKLSSLFTELIQMCRSCRAAVVVMPQTVREYLWSQACHGAIKFGDRIDKKECLDLIMSLATCRLPFQCAHGRPSLLPLIDVNELKEISSSEQSKPNLSKVITMMNDSLNDYG